MSKYKYPDKIYYPFEGKYYIIPRHGEHWEISSVRYFLHFVPFYIRYFSKCMRVLGTRGGWRYMCSTLRQWHGKEA